MFRVQTALLPFFSFLCFVESRALTVTLALDVTLDIATVNCVTRYNNVSTWATGNNECVLIYPATPCVGISPSRGARNPPGPKSHTSPTWTLVQPPILTLLPPWTSSLPPHSKSCIKASECVLMCHTI